MVFFAEGSAGFCSGCDGQDGEGCSGSGTYCILHVVEEFADVCRQIKYANSKGLPFLAASGRHGWTKDLGGVKNGVMINLRGLNSTQVKRDGKTAVAGGGILQYEMVQSLYEEGKYGGKFRVVHFAVGGREGC